MLLFDYGMPGIFVATVMRLLRTVNDFRHTPLTMAAELGKVNMFSHLMSKEKELMWMYGTVSLSSRIQV